MAATSPPASPPAAGSASPATPSTWKSTAPASWSSSSPPSAATSLLPSSQRPCLTWSPCAPASCLPALPEPGATAAVEAIPASPTNDVDVTLVSEHVSEEHGALELTSAEVVVGLGMGIGEGNVAAAQQLASSIGASICTTRNVVHSGWLPHHIQVGISGRTIAPQVYLAVGIRGAFNHTVGIQKAGVILAINRNHRAAIFRAADYGIVGDWNEYLPPLIDAIRPILTEHGLA